MIECDEDAKSQSNVNVCSIQSAGMQYGVMK